MLNAVRTLKPSPATGIALVALFVALGGSSYAALALPKASVGAKQLKKNSVTSPKIKPGSLLSSDFKASQRAGLRGPAGLQGPQGPQGPQGVQGQQGANGAALAYAHVIGGTVAPAESSGIPGSFSNPSTGVYCLADAPAGAKSVLVSASTQGVSPAAGDLFASVDMVIDNNPGNYTGCASATDNVRVTLYDLSLHAQVNGSFRIWFED